MRLKWGNIEDAMDWFPQVFEAERAVETPQTQGSCQCPFNQVWEKPMKPPWEPLIYILEKINKMGIVDFGGSFELHPNQMLRWIKVCFQLVLGQYWGPEFFFET